MKLKERIIRCAAQAARQDGLTQFMRETVARMAECSEANVSYHYGTMEQLRVAVVEFAVEHEHIEVLAQARAIRHPSLGRMSPALKERVATHIVGK